MSKRTIYRDLYVAGKTPIQIAAAFGVTEQNIYYHKKDDKKKGMNWDELRLAKMTDIKDIREKETSFISVLLHDYEEALESLKDLKPIERLEALRKYATAYYKLKAPKEHSVTVDKIRVAQDVISQMANLAVDLEYHSVIEFLSKESDTIIHSILKKG